MELPDIRWMQAAIVLAEELNFSRAAERLDIAQSTLRKQILELENHLGFALFERNHQVVELTDAGGQKLGLLSGVAYPDERYSPSNPSAQRRRIADSLGWE